MVQIVANTALASGTGKEKVTLQFRRQQSEGQKLANMIQLPEERTLRQILAFAASTSGLRCLGDEDYYYDEQENGYGSYECD